FRCRHPDVDDRITGIQPPDFRISAEIAHQNDLVHASSHNAAPMLVRTFPSRLYQPTPSSQPIRQGEGGKLCISTMFLICSSSRTILSQAAHESRVKGSVPGRNRALIGHFHPTRPGVWRYLGCFKAKP